MRVDPFDVDENTRNLYLIRRQLAELKRIPNHSYFIHYVGNYSITISPNAFMESVDYGPDDRITKHELLNIYLFEVMPASGDAHYIGLDVDPRFKDYAPIKYNEYGSSNGERIPLNQLCELVKYLHRLSNLAVFM